MVVEHSPWLETWYENSSFVRIPIEKFNISTLSFTYGDSHPTFSSRVNDGKEYRKSYNIDEEKSLWGYKWRNQEIEGLLPDMEK